MCLLKPRADPRRLVTSEDSRCLEIASRVSTNSIFHFSYGKSNEGKEVCAGLNWEDERYQLLRYGLPISCNCKATEKHGKKLKVKLIFSGLAV